MLFENVTPLAFFTVVILIVVIAIRSSLRRRAMDYDHTERMYSLERGNPIPDNLPSHLENLHHHHMRHPRLPAIILCAVGLGLLVSEVVLWDFDNIAIATILFFVGGAWWWAVKEHDREHDREHKDPMMG